MPQQVPDLETTVLVGIVTSVAIVVLVLLLPIVRAYARGASWVGVLGWWLLVALLWIPLVLGDGFQVGVPVWLAARFALVFGVLVHVLILSPPLFALGATLIWLLSRGGKPNTGPTPR